MYKIRWFVTAVFLFLPVTAFTQQAIPPDKEGLVKGLGMGLAEIAEINNYPGPKHTLDLKNELGLTRDQLKKTEALDKVVTSAALAKGPEIILAEEELSKLFEAGAISEKVLRSKLEEIGKLRADLRFIHLQAHLRMKQILTPDQIKQYSELRGHEAKHEN
jgi:Spy/CpxP family protein refolding chaperone